MQNDLVSQSQDNSAVKLPKNNIFMSHFTKDEDNDLTFDTASVVSSYVGKSRLGRAKS